MASDDDVEMAEADFPRFSTVEKGKGKAAEPPLREEDNSLPWCVSSLPHIWSTLDASSLFQGGKVPSCDHGGRSVTQGYYQHQYVSFQYH